VRSATEIGRVLQAMCADGDPVTASIESGEVLFMSRLLHVDPSRSLMVIACSPEKARIPRCWPSA
jgi:hypothetical protein